MKRIAVLVVGMALALASPTFAGANGSDSDGDQPGANQFQDPSGAQPFEDDEGELGVQGECESDAETPPNDDFPPGCEW